MRGQHTGTESAPGGTASEGAPKVSQTDHLGYAHLLGQVDLFLGLERVTLAKLAAHLEPLFYPSGSIIFRQAEPGDAFYLVATGSVGVYSASRTNAAETRVKVLHAGEPFGEMALLTNSPRTATIRLRPIARCCVWTAAPFSISFVSSPAWRSRSPPRSAAVWRQCWISRRWSMQRLLLRSRMPMLRRWG